MKRRTRTIEAITLPEITRACTWVFASLFGLQVLLEYATATATNPPAPLETASEDYRGDNSQIVAPGTGLPAGTVPMGYTRTTLPAGLQILARPYQEGVIFRLAYAYEQGTMHRRPPDGFPTLLLSDSNK